MEMAGALNEDELVAEYFRFLLALFVPSTFIWKLAKGLSSE